MKPLHLALVMAGIVAGAGGCQGPQDFRPTLQHDYVLPPASSLGVARQGLSVGDGPNGEHVIYLNFDGQTVTHNFGDNSANNQSSIASTTRAIPAFDESPYAPTYNRTSAINAIVNQYQAYFAAYNVQVVTTRPSTGRYTMMLIGGTPQDLHGNIGPTSEAGISVMDCGNNQEINVGFVFSAVLSPSQTGSSKTIALQQVALDAAHESGHTFGLEHTGNTSDIMYPAIDLSMTGFQNTSMQLTDGSSVCGGGSTQNSAARLLANLGAASGGGGPTNPKPTVAFVYPKNNSSIGHDIEFKVIAQPPAGGALSNVEVTVFGQSINSSPTSPVIDGFSLNQDGNIQLTATATDGQGNSAVSTVSLSLHAGGAQVTTSCSTDNDCNAPLVCNQNTHECDWTNPPPTGGGTDGGTVGAGGHDGGSGTGGGPGGQGGPTPAPGTLGSACATHDDCESHICATLGDTKFCTQACDPANAASCPAQMACSGSGSEYYCAPALGGGGGGGGGCSTGGSDASQEGTALATSIMLLFALVVVRRRAIA